MQVALCPCCGKPVRPKAVTPFSSGPLLWVHGQGFPKSHNLSGEWDGWGTALKPAYEPVIMARKPLSGTVAANVLEWGTGAINVDGCRVGTETLQYRSRLAKHMSSAHAGEPSDSSYYRPYTNGIPNQSEPQTTSSGRWPANIIHDGSDDVLRLFPVTGPSSSRPPTGKPKYTGSQLNSNAMRGSSTLDTTIRGHDDAGGSAARFFYTAKASKRDRDEGLEGFELRVASVGNLDAAGRDPTNSNNYYGEGAKRRVENGELPSIPRANHHPTVKPTSLMQYLCRLVTPPNGIILDPFMGSGSTGKAAMYEGFRFIGIEREAEYIEIARARIEYARKQAAQAKQSALLAMAAD